VERHHCVLYHLERLRAQSCIIGHPGIVVGLQRLGHDGWKAEPRAKVARAKAVAARAKVVAARAATAANSRPTKQTVCLALMVIPTPTSNATPAGITAIPSKSTACGTAIGTQQQQEWGLVTSYLTGMKTITSNGTEHSYPFSVSKDGTLVCPALERRKPSEAPSLSVNGQDLQSRQELQACIAEAAQVVASGVPGAFGNAWMESTPSVPLADNSAELQRHEQLKERLILFLRLILLLLRVLGHVEA
jgi:hypothetical protein